MNSLLHALRNRSGTLVPLLLAGLVTLLVKQGTPPPPGLCLLGNADARLTARIPPVLAERQADAARMTLGVGLAAIDGWESLGEALVLNGEVFQRSSDHGSPRYYRLLRGQHFYTSSFAFLPPRARPRERRALRPGQGFVSLWRELGRHYPDGALVAGLVQFRVLQTVAISRPPIRGLAVNENIAHYYTEPMETASMTRAWVIGLVARQDSPLPRRDDPLFVRLLVQRADGQLDSYAHALTLTLTAHSGSDTAQAVNVGRIAGGSIIEQGELAIYPAHRVAECNGILLEPAGRRAGPP